nr:DNA-directed RNA polymerases II, IV and V subunit RPB3 [Seculamonas ecuadoriensis]
MDTRILVLDPSDDEFRFRLVDTDLSVANALRRAIIAEVPTIAIEFVEVESNTSPLVDDMLVHRLGLVPLDSTDVGAMRYPHECACDDGECNECSKHYEMHVHCTEEKRAVTSADLVPVNHDVLPATKYELLSAAYVRGTGTVLLADASAASAASQHAASQHAASQHAASSQYAMDTDALGFASQTPLSQSHAARSTTIDAPISITRLARDQDLKLHAVARKGTGRTHAKWIPVGSVAMKAEPHIVLNQHRVTELKAEERRAFAATCPRGVYKFDAASNQLTVERPQECIYCQECKIFANEQVKMPDLVSVREARGPRGYPNFDFILEPTGALRSADIVLTALRELKTKLRILQEEIRQAVPMQ